MTRTRQQAEAAGRRAEWLAAWWLRCKGYRVLERRVTGAVGEIDLLVRRGEWLIAVEVKFRPTMDQALSALSARQLQRILRSLEIVAARRGHTGPIRCDLLAMAPHRWPHHIIGVHD